MNLIWKLLRQHISIAQFAGFFFANLFGMFIVLLGVQFYRDVLPVFTAEDSFMKADYLVVSKQIGTAGTLSGRSSAFTQQELSDITLQPFIRKAGTFMGNEFRVTAQMGVSGTNILHSEIFMQSIPDEFIDAPKADWQYREGSIEVPVILPRTYINMYNFGLAQSRSLPKISDGLVGMIDLALSIRGVGGETSSDNYQGRVIGFSNRMNEILVPASFMKWANAKYAPSTTPEVTRLIVEVDNPASETITRYLDSHGYELDKDQLNAEKTTYFLRLVVTIVMVVGLIISLLSFYILMLSVYLLVQKNSSKLESLLLIGYSPRRVALPYQLLTLGLNAVVLVIAIVVLWLVRDYYMDIIFALFPQIEEGTMLPALCVGGILFALVTVVNYIAIQRKISGIYFRK